MYLFIFESLGTQELILVGMVALIVFGPRKLPQMAKKAAKMIREVRSVSNDFRSTWEKEISLDDSSDGSVTANEDTENSILGEDKESPGEITIPADDGDVKSILPEVREVSKEEFKKILEQNKEVETPKTEKRDWL